MSFNFYDNIPVGPNNPSDDQPLMLQNNISTKQILNVDLNTFDSVVAGTHQQMHLPSFTSPAVINGTATQGSVIYTKAGVADKSYAQLSFKNAHNFDMPLNLIKAYSYCDTNGAFVNLQSINITSVTRQVASLNQYNVVINANVVGSADFTVYSSNVNGLIYTYNITSPTTFQLFFSQSDGTLIYPTFFSFFILQL